MKGELRNIADMMHCADTDARLAFELWDGETVIHGNQPEVALLFHSREGAKQVLSNTKGSE